VLIYDSYLRRLLTMHVPLLVILNKSISSRFSCFCIFHQSNLVKIYEIIYSLSPKIDAPKIDAFSKNSRNFQNSKIFWWALSMSFFDEIFFALMGVNEFFNIKSNKLSLLWRSALYLWSMWNKSICFNNFFLFCDVKCNQFSPTIWAWWWCCLF